MDFLSILKTVGGPGSLGFLLVSLVAGLIVSYVWPRNRMWGRRWMLAVVFLYLFLSLPGVARALAGRLPDVQTTASSAATFSTLIVLDGDNRTGRAIETRRIYLAAPATTIWVLGGREIRDELQGLGVPRDRLKIDGRDPTTRHQMVHVKTIAEAGPDTVGLIASRVQMPRVAALATASGVRVALIPSQVDWEPPVSGIRLFLPSLAALVLSRDVIYEHAALAYYRWRRWI